MIVTRLSGGLGNQLFEYATARSIALRHGASLYLDTSHYRDDPKRTYSLEAFNIKAKIFEPSVADVQKLRRIEEKDHSHFDPAVKNAPDDVDLNGLWQSYKYFEDIRPTLLKEISLKNKPGAKATELLDRISKAGSVAIHVRRGDYVNELRTQKFHGLLPVDYYKEAVERIRAQVPTPSFFVFSDDIDWAQKNLDFLGSGVTFVSHEGLQDAEELIIMSKANHFILANSTFGWWAAWLSQSPNKTVIVPERWFRNRSVSAKDLIPAEWIRILPLVSVVMPVYNGEKYVASAIESVLAQTYKNFELFIIDNASTDSTPIILKNFAAQDPRVKVITNPSNLGLIASLNIGVKAATGRYIARADHDDLCLPERFADEVDYFDDHPDIVIVGGFARVMDPAGVDFGFSRKPSSSIEIYYELMFGNALIHPSIMMRRKDVVAAGGYNPDKVHVEDYDLYSRMAHQGRKLGNIPWPLIRYRQHPESLTNASESQKIQHANTRRQMKENISWYTSLSGDEERLLHEVVTARHPNPACTWHDFMAGYRLHKRIYTTFVAKEKIGGSDAAKIRAYYRGRRNLMIKKYIIGKYQCLRSLFRK